MNNFCFLFLLATVPLITTSGSSLVNQFECPAYCQCTVSDFNAVRCSDRNLDSVPHLKLPTAVELLDISYNQLTVLPNNSFSDYENVKRLCLKYSQISSLERDTFRGLKSLIEVDLSYNYIEYIHPDSFPDSEVLEVVLLHNNYLLNIPSQHPLLNAPSVTDLDLSECKLTRLSPQVFSGLPRIKTLNLRKNELKTLTPSILSPLRDLSYIDISSNHLTELNTTVFDGLSKLTSVYMNNNPLSCNSRNLQFMCWWVNRTSQEHKPVFCYNEGNRKQKLWTKNTPCSQQISTVLEHADHTTILDMTTFSESQKVNEVHITEPFKIISIPTEVSIIPKQKLTSHFSMTSSPDHKTVDNVSEIQEETNFWNKKMFSLFHQIILLSVVYIVIVMVFLIRGFTKRCREQTNRQLNREELMNLNT